jgi:hypothetical protein
MIRKRSKSKAVSDFISFIHEWGHPEWIILAAEAPVEKVAIAYAAAKSAKRHWPEIPIHQLTRKDDEIAPLVAIVQPADCPWSIIYRCLCLPIESDDVEAAQKDAQLLSAKLKTKAFAFCGEDTSMAMACILYQKGRQTGSKDWDSQFDEADKAFSNLGLYLPICFPRRAGKKSWLAAKEPSQIQRVDLLDFGESYP